jgi:hypothetical protein
LLAQRKDKVLHDCPNKDWGVKTLESPPLKSWSLSFGRNLNYTSKVARVLHFKSSGHNVVGHLLNSPCAPFITIAYFWGENIGKKILICNLEKK